MPAQITLFTLDDVNRGQSERPRATHAAAQIERILSPGVISAERPDACHLVIRERWCPLREVILSVPAQH